MQHVTCNTCRHEYFHEGEVNQVTKKREPVKIEKCHACGSTNVSIEMVYRPEPKDEDVLSLLTDAQKARLRNQLGDAD